MSIPDDPLVSLVLPVPMTPTFSGLNVELEAETATQIFPASHFPGTKVVSLLTGATDQNIKGNWTILHSGE